MKYLFGPVPSRRLGLSLGIDLLNSKICNFDCIYCEVGKTTLKTNKRGLFVNKKEVLVGLETYLKSCSTRPDFLTFSGSGEPTLHQEIGNIINEIKSITTIPIAVITNSTLLNDPCVRTDLKKANLVLPSLDAVTQEVFLKINRPVQEIIVQDIISGLETFRKEYAGQIWLEILFCEGINDSTEEIIKMKEIIDTKIRPDKIQINTVVRPPLENYVQPLLQDRLFEIKGILGEKAELIVNFKNTTLVTKTKKEINNKIKKIIATMVERRPSTLEDIATSLSLNKTELAIYLGQMISEQKLSAKKHDDKLYYYAHIQ
ncbi:MAG: radical SAM protein [bacterium]